MEHPSDNPLSPLGPPMEPEPLGDARAAERVGGAPPGNTAPPKYKADELRALKVAPGAVDSLYVSYAGTLFDSVAEDLADRKRLAQSPEPEAQELAQYASGSLLFAVSDKGRRGAEFVLRNPHLQLDVSRGPRMPLAYVQLGSSFLTAVGVDAALQRVRNVVNGLGSVAGDETVSRLDLCADFVPSLPFSHWPDERWVTRAVRRDSHLSRCHFTGWSFGASADLSARLYDKRYEVEHISQKVHMDSVWESAGIAETDPVWRLEFQLRRSVLKEFGIQSWSDAKPRLGDLWAYCMKWLSLREPNGDENRSRWPVAPLWVDLAHAPWSGFVAPAERSKTAGEMGIRSAMQFICGVLSTLMARHGIVNFAEGLGTFLHWAEVLCMNEGHTFAQSVEQQARVKAAKLCTVNNREGLGVDRVRVAASAEAYRSRRSGPGLASGSSSPLMDDGP